MAIRGSSDYCNIALEVPNSTWGFMLSGFLNMHSLQMRATIIGISKFSNLWIYQLRGQNESEKTEGSKNREEERAK